MAKETNDKKKKNSKKHGLGVVRSAIMGEFLNYKFFVKIWAYILVMLVLILASIASRYQAQYKMDYIIKLKQELAYERTEKVKASATYNSLIREPEMRKRLREAGINLSISDQPPYKIEE